MHRQPLLRKLREHHTPFAHEQQMVQQMITFVEENEHCFERSLEEGHVTASAWIVNPAHTHVLLIHHLKLDKWLQPGGHCDGDPDVLAVALKEAWEETGLKITTSDNNIFDVDIHLIPARKDIPAHLHYDARFLVEASMDDGTITNEAEVTQIKWIPLGEVSAYNNEDSILRMVNKTNQY